MPVRSIHSPKLWTCVEHLLKEEDEHVCVLPMTTLIKPVRVITLVQIDTTATAAAAGCPPGSANLEPCHDLSMDLSTGTAPWRLVSAPDGSTLKEKEGQLAPVTSPHPEWNAPTGNAKWLGDSSNAASSGDHVFELTINLCCGFSNPTGVLTIRADQDAEILLNGKKIGEVAPGSFSWKPAYTPTDIHFEDYASELHIGDNILRVVVHNVMGVNNNATNPMGLLASGFFKAEQGASVK